MEKLEIAFTTRDTIEAGFIQSLFQANGIECFVKNLHYATLSLTGAGAAPILIMVRPEDGEKAREIVEQYYKDLRGEKDEDGSPEGPAEK